MGIEEQVSAILAYGECCDSCLGRFFGKLSFGLTNRERGHALRVSHGLALNTPFREPEAICWICGGICDRFDVMAEKVAESLAGIEFSSFVIGSRIPPLVAENEEMCWGDLHLAGAEPLKTELNREVGKRVSERTGREADLRHPDLVALVDLRDDTITVQITPVFFSGSYRKLERGIPQTHWDCRSCHGAGCERCDFTGKQYQDSVEELIGRPAVAAFAAEWAVLHGCGREDIDARMLGGGRPFVMEMVGPRIRSLDLGSLEQEINRSASGRVEVTLTGWTGRDAVEIIKSERAHKKYRILVEIDGEVSPEKLEQALSSIRGATIRQRTPERVAHRRADRVRPRKVLEIGSAGKEGSAFVIEVTGESGLYIKELISGDHGRTEPSLSGLLGTEARVIALDVVQVG
jgi:tRNA pseudouridine synthase 10